MCFSFDKWLYIRTIDINHTENTESIYLSSYFELILSYTSEIITTYMYIQILITMFIVQSDALYKCQDAGGRCDHHKL